MCNSSVCCMADKKKELFSTVQFPSKLKTKLSLSLDREQHSLRASFLLIQGQCYGPISENETGGSDQPISCLRKRGSACKRRGKMRSTCLHNPTERTVTAHSHCGLLHDPALTTSINMTQTMSRLNGIQYQCVTFYFNGCIKIKNNDGKGIAKFLILVWDHNVRTLLHDVTNEIAQREKLFHGPLVAELKVTLIFSMDDVRWLTVEAQSTALPVGSSVQKTKLR